MIESDQLLVTFFLFSYNQENYIEDACAAVLAQTYSPLEIIFSDDCSSDRTFDLIEEMVKNYSGPHKVKINRNHQNLGLIGHVNKSFEISSGELIVVAAGDDISLPYRVKYLVDKYIQSSRQALVLHSSAIKINDSSDDLGLFVPTVIERSMSPEELVDCQSLYIGATAAWSRSLYNEFGPIIFCDAYEDLVLGFRGVIKDSLFYVDKPLVKYRVGVGISAKVKIPIWKYSLRVAIRIKKMKISLDVYEQRLRDISRAEKWDRDGALKTRLIKNINFQKKRILFYRNPLNLLGCVFSKDFITVLRSFNSEVKYLVGLND